MMNLIDYSRTDREIYFLDEWVISIFTIDMQLIKEIELDINNSAIRKITYFKHIEKNKTFQIVGSDFNNIIYSFQFDMQGMIVSNEILSDKKKDIFLELDNDNMIDVLFVDEDYSWNTSCIIYKNNKEILSTDLHDECEKLNKDWCLYEYIECLSSTNQSNQLSFITVHANYGVQGVKIFRINRSSQLELVYDMDDLEFDGAFHNLTFNSKGEKFILLLYNRDENLTDYFSICEYSVDSNEPLEIYKTGFGYWEFGKLFTHYLTDSILCIVRNADIILFDLVSGQTKKILNRDLNSSYFVTFNIIIYQFNQETIVLQF